LNNGSDISLFNNLFTDYLNCQNCPPVYLSVCLPAYLLECCFPIVPACLSVYLSVCVRQPFCISTFLPACPPSAQLSVHCLLPNCLYAAYISTCFSVSVYQSISHPSAASQSVVCLSACQSVSCLSLSPSVSLSLFSVCQFISLPSDFSKNCLIGPCESKGCFLLCQTDWSEASENSFSKVGQ